MSEEDSNIYYTNVHQAYINAGFEIKEFGNCPLLMSENLLRKAEHKLCDLMKPIAKIDLEDCLCSADGLKNAKELIELNLKLLVPFLKKHQKHIDSLIEIAKQL